MMENHIGCSEEEGKQGAQMNGHVNPMEDGPVAHMNGQVKNTTDGPINQMNGHVRHTKEAPVIQMNGHVRNTMDGPVSQMNGHVRNKMDAPVIQMNGHVRNTMDAPVIQMNGHVKAATETKEPPLERNTQVPTQKPQAPQKLAKSTSKSESTATSPGDSKKFIPVPPDGGWGWVIVVASFFCNALVDGMCCSFGVFLPHYLDYFGEGRGKTALAGSLMPGFFLSSGPVASVLVNAVGCRIVTIVGCILCTVALIISTFSFNVNMLIITNGVLGGIGLGFIYLPAMVMVGFYFERRRALATGIACSGAGIGMLIIAPTAAALLSEFDWKNSILILAAFPLQCVVLGALMRPLTAKNNTKKVKEDLEMCDDDDTDPDGGDDDSKSAILGKEMGNCNRDQDNRVGDEDNVSVIMVRERVSNHCFLGNSMIGLCTPHNSMQSLRSISRRSNGKSSGSHLAFDDESRTGHLVPKHRLDIKGSHGNRNGFLEPTTQPLITKSLHTLPIVQWKNEKRLEQPQTFGSERTVHQCSNKPHLQPHEISTSCHNLSSSSSESDVQRSITRKDKFYSGSVATLDEYKSQPDVVPYMASIPKEEKSQQNTCSCVPRSTWMNIKEMIDITILSNPYFLVIACASIFIQIGYFMPIFFLPEYAQSLGIDENKGATLISAIGISNAIGRAGAGCLANLPRVKPLHINNISLIITGVSTIVAVYACNTYVALLVYACVYGFFVAAFVPLTNIFLVEYLGLHRLTNAFGLLSLVRGIATMVGPPIAGSLRDCTSSYDLAFIFGGVMFIAAGLVHYLLPCIQRWEKHKGMYNLQQDKEHMFDVKAGHNVGEQEKKDIANEGEIIS